MSGNARSFRCVIRVVRQLALAAMSVFACQTCAAATPVGGPHFYRSWNSFFVPVRPVDPVPRATAETLPKYCEAFFDSKGRILRFLKRSNGQTESETTYAYRVGGGFEERICWNGQLTVTEYDKKGKEVASRRIDGGCSIAQTDTDGGA